MDMCSYVLQELLSFLLSMEKNQIQLKYHFNKKKLGENNHFQVGQVRHIFLTK
jgi:hypothetical protein